MWWLKLTSIKCSPRVVRSAAIQPYAQRISEKRCKRKAFFVVRTMNQMQNRITHFFLSIFLLRYIVFLCHPYGHTLQRIWFSILEVTLSRVYIENDRIQHCFINKFFFLHSSASYFDCHVLMLIGVTTVFCIRFLFCLHSSREQKKSPVESREKKLCIPGKKLSRVSVSQIPK